MFYPTCMEGLIIKTRNQTFNRFNPPPAQATHSMVNKSIAASDQTTATAAPPQDATLDFMA